MRWQINEYSARHFSNIINMLNELKILLPNFPEEVLIDWIEPYAKIIGLPPTHQRWEGILASKSLEFWQATHWKKITLDLSTLEFSESTKNNLDGMSAAQSGEDNFYALIEDSQKRIFQALRFLLEHGIFPKPILLLREKDKYSVVDGNHRFLAWQNHRLISHGLENQNTNQEKAIVDGFRKTILNKWNIPSIVSFSKEQEVWVSWI